MNKMVSKVSLLSAVFLLSACGGVNKFHLPKSNGEHHKAAEQVNPELANIESNAVSARQFEYRNGSNIYTAFLTNSSLLLINDKGKNQENKIYFKGNHVFAVIQAGNYFEFDTSGKLLKGDTIKGAEVLKYAKRLQRILGVNKADSSVSRVRTGDDAKLNYLCIAKIQQVAETKRVFRSSANHANSNQRLTADVRLNGNQFYAMDCQLNGDYVSKLSLSIK